MAENYVSYANATALMTKIGNKLSALSSAFMYMGSVAFANLPSSLTSSMTGYVYNVSNDFTTDARFVEGAGKQYSAGTNVVVVNAGTAQSPDMKFDVNGNFIDLTPLENEIVVVSHLTAPDFAQTSAYAIGDIVKYEGKLYKFKAAHAANTAWNTAEVDETTVAALLKSLQTQINGKQANLGLYIDGDGDICQND